MYGHICHLYLFCLLGEEDNLKDKFGNLAYDLRSPELKDSNKFPNADQSQRRLEVIQRSGEVIFVPSGWHHQVFNMVCN